MKKALLSLLTVSVLAGCQSNKIGPPDGTGAILVPVSIDFKNAFNFVCRSISFEINDEEKSFNISVDKYVELLDDYERHTGFGLIQNIEPGQYTIEKARCYAQSGRIFHNGGSYITFLVNTHIEVLPSTLSVLDYGVSGEISQNTDGTRSFDVYWDYMNPGVQKRTLKQFASKNEELSKWSVVLVD